MNGIDSNVLLRLLTEDDPAQVALARGAVDGALPGAPLFVSVIVLVETAWVLRSQFQVAAPDILLAIEALLSNAEFFLEDGVLVQQAIDRSRELNIGLADGLIALRNRRLGCETTLTFDRKAARLPTFRLLADA